MERGEGVCGLGMADKKIGPVAEAVRGSFQVIFVSHEIADVGLDAALRHRVDVMRRCFAGEVDQLVHFAFRWKCALPFVR